MLDFPSRVINIVVEVKAHRPPHVIQLLLGLSRRMLPVEELVNPSIQSPLVIGNIVKVIKLVSLQHCYCNFIVTFDAIAVGNST